MYVQFDRLADALGRRMPVKTFHVMPRVISHIEMFPWNYDPERDSLSQDTAYVCEYRKLREFPLRTELAPLVCVIERDAQRKDVFFSGRQVILVGGGTVADVLVTLLDIVYETGCQSSPLTPISRRLTQCRDVQELIDAGFELLGNPLILTDDNQQIVAYTDTERVSAGAYREIVEMGHLPIGHPQPSNGQELWEPVDFPFYQKGAGELPAVLCKQLTLGRRTEGYLHVLQFNRELTGDESPTVELLGNLLADAMQNSPGIVPRSDRSRQIERFLREILDNEKDEEYIRQRQESVGLRLKPHLCTVVISARRADLIPRVSFYELSHQIADLLPGCFGMLYRSAVFLLIHSEEEITDFRSFLEPIVPLMQKHHLIAGVSHPFRSLSQLRDHGYQSRKAQQLGLLISPEDSIFRFRDTLIWYMMELCLEKERPDALCLPEVRKLLEMGGDNNELIQTLRAYLKCGRRKSQTARELFVHLSTVKYRLGQIESILGLDLDDDDTALMLQLSFKLLEYSDMLHGPR